MIEKIKKLKSELAAEYRKPKAKNIGKDGAKYYRGTKVDQVRPRDPQKIVSLHAEINSMKTARAKKTKALKRRSAEWHAEMRVASFIRRGKTMTYVPTWKKRSNVA